MNRTHKSLILLVSLLSTLTALAFPPAPYYTLYGMVRDQVGQTLTAEGAEVVLLKEGVEIGRTPITANRIDQSYELNVRMDQTRSGTALYSDKAVSVGGLFSLVVEMNGSTFYPIEVSGTLAGGQWRGTHPPRSYARGGLAMATAYRTCGSNGSCIRPASILLPMAVGT